MRGTMPDSWRIERKILNGHANAGQPSRRDAVTSELHRASGIIQLSGMGLSPPCIPVMCTRHSPSSDIMRMYRFRCCLQARRVVACEAGVPHTMAVSPEHAVASLQSSDKHVHAGCRCSRAPNVYCPCDAARSTRQTHANAA